MKKLIVLLLISYSVFQAQTCKRVTDNRTNKPMLIGQGARADFADSSFSSWFNEGYKFYKPHFAGKKTLSSKLKNYKIKIVMGTWCSDSRREVPAFYKVLDELQYPTDKVNLVFVNRKLKAPGVDKKKENITNVPTIIVSQKGKEVGRIVESPINTLESDLSDILNNKKSEMK